MSVWDHIDQQIRAYVRQREASDLLVRRVARLLHMRRCLWPWQHHKAVRVGRLLDVLVQRSRHPRVTP